MPRRPNPTEVFSFRLPVDTAKVVNRQIKKEKTTRAKFAEKLFLEAFDRFQEAKASSVPQQA